MQDKQVKPNNTKTVCRSSIAFLILFANKVAGQFYADNDPYNNIMEIHMLCAIEKTGADIEVEKIGHPWEF